MYKIMPETRLKIVQYYLYNNTTLMETAQKFKVNYRSVFKWVKLYKEKGEERLLCTYKRPWNRASKELEEKVVLLKERNPNLTVRKAREILEQQGVKISIKGIWNIWKRYGYAGFRKQNMSYYWIDYCPWSKEAAKKYEQAKYLFNIGKIKRSAKVLNSIPFLPRNELMLKMPEEFLNFRRQIEKISFLYGKIPYKEYIKKLTHFYKSAKRRGLKYSAIRIGTLRIIALEWGGEMERLLREIEDIKILIKTTRKHKLCSSYLLFEPMFTLSISEGIASAALLKTQKAEKIAKNLEKLLKIRKIVSPYFMLDLAVLYTHIENYEKATHWLLKCREYVDNRVRSSVDSHLAKVFLHKCNHKMATKFLRNAMFGEWGNQVHAHLAFSLLYFNKGAPHKAIQLATESLDLAKKEELYRCLSNAYFIVASSFAALGEKERAKDILKKDLKLLKRLNIKREKLIYETLLEKENLSSKSRNMLPTLKILLLLRKENYIKTFNYAVRKGLISYLYRFLSFFPEIVVKRIKKGKSTYLPKSILKLPVFNKDAFVFDVRFLGRLKVYRSYGGESEKSKVKSKKLKVEGDRLKELLRLNLTPKEKAFLIHLALRLPEPGRTISLEKIYKNFWRDSKKPERNLSHLLTKIRKQLKIPVHLLEISRRGGYPVLKNNGIYFITDYLEFKEKVARARALLRAEEYEFAKREFKSALKLVRGEPFKKMYDTWSEDKRMEILLEVERAKEEFNKINA